MHEISGGASDTEICVSDFVSLQGLVPTTHNVSVLGTSFNLANKLAAVNYGINSNVVALLKISEKHFGSFYFSAKLLY